MATELLQAATALQQYLCRDELGQFPFERKSRQYISWVMKDPHHDSNYHTDITGYYAKEFKEVKNKTNAEQKIAKYTGMNDDWDGYGASAPTLKTIYNSIIFLASLPEELINHLDPDDDIIPNPHGTLSFEWRFESNKIFVEIGDDEMNMFKLVDNKYTALNNCPISFGGAFSDAYEAINCRLT